MKIKGNLFKYERLQFEFEDCNKADYMLIRTPLGEIETVYPFNYQPVEFFYNDEGYETVKPIGNTILTCRYTPRTTGEYVFELYDENVCITRAKKTIQESLNHGYVQRSTIHSKYFSYTDEEPFVWMGINLAFPTDYMESNGQEFGLSGNQAYIGLRQYERWFKKCANNGVNVVRLWLGHPYWTPDTKEAYQFDDVQWSKIDAVVTMAARYGIKLKLTIEHFRYFDKEKLKSYHPLFYKELWQDEKLCESMTAWLTGKQWIDAWTYKVNELSKRYSGDTTVCMIELWNEMNCVDCEPKVMIDWNKNILPQAKRLFPYQLVTTSFGSLDSDYALNYYRKFCWADTDALQIHRYLDQGASNRICGGDLVTAIKDAFGVLNIPNLPTLLAETGAVNNCHSGPFRYYVNDDRGIIFVDCVYTPLFVGSAGCGNIWHWNERYVESKNLYKYFAPLSKLIANVDFAKENFQAIDFSTDEAHILILKGQTQHLGFARNKSDSWVLALRDNAPIKKIERLAIDFQAKHVESYPIWDEDTTKITVKDGKVVLSNITYGTLFKLL